MEFACSQGQSRCSDPCKRSYWLRCGERKPKAIVWKIFRERYPKQVLYFVKVNTNGKLETRTKGIVDKCSDLTCTKKYALTEGPKWGGGGVKVGLSLSPPSHFMLATGRDFCSKTQKAFPETLIIKLEKRLKPILHFPELRQLPASQ